MPRSRLNRILQLDTATIADLDTLVELDQLCFGKLWSRDTYAREIDSPNSDILLLRSVNSAGNFAENFAGNSADSDPGNETNPNPNQTTNIYGYGCVWAILDEAHITILGVHPQQRRQGLGKLLLLGLLAAAHQRGLTRATLEVSTKNRAAIELYEKIGFQQAGCRKGYYANGDDAAILWKSGLQHPNFRTTLKTLRTRSHETIAHSGWMLDDPDLGS